MDFSDANVPSFHSLLQSGDPFVPFSEFSIETSRDLLSRDGSNWVQDRLKEGRPFVLRGFNRLESWNASIFNKDSLAVLSSSEAIPIRNCQSGRDVRMRLRDLLSTAGYDRTNIIKELLYAKDLQCPSEWIRALETVLPSSLRHLGSLDLFRVLPKEIVPEVLMAYVGTRKSLCFSATVALNLLIGSEGPGTLCFGTDTSSRTQYDAFMEELGKSSHTDWANVPIEKLKLAKFPIYITYQEPGDLVVFPSATSHQIWNTSSLVTKVVWNIMHASSLESFFDYVQPVYQMQCHADTGRVPLIPFHALNSSLRVPETRLLLEIFQRLVDDEDIGNDPNVSVKLVDTQGAVVEKRSLGTLAMAAADARRQQVRGKKANLPLHGVSPHGDITPRGQKRSRGSSEDEQVKVWLQNGHAHLPSARPEVVDITPSNGTSFNAPSCNGSLGPKGQLRISDLVEDQNSPVEATSTPRSGIMHQPMSSASSVPQNGTSRDPSGPRNDRRHSEFPSSGSGESIAALERKLDNLRQSADVLMDLTLTDSHAEVMETIRQLESEIKQRKRAKAEVLFNNLSRDFPHLADLAREEARRRGIQSE
ncbi:uncharacterized protein KD926_007247 [Aspergillus affinis]|uniref:uncharacterized protein n=1 Tax=Aspergillus affinis TaxID=1070780 RepID=UPI0022FE4E47|nr:uncharacterized protein KD926_007247 [Aspergillus affinis]KAI9041293.1 hypothetical protein KD926_007247 [Aspergillus affinis]